MLRNKKEVALERARDEAKDRRELFVREYLVNGNNAAAAGETYGIEDGYKFFKTVAVQAEYAKQLQILMARLGITQLRVLQEISALAFLDIGQLLNDDGSPKKLSEIPEATRRAIVGLDIEEIFAGYGAEREMVGHLKKYRIGSKEKALEMLAKYLGLQAEVHKVEHSGTIEHVKVDPAQTQAMLEALAKKTLDESLE